VIFVPEMDAIINPRWIKGIGVVANVGTSAAIANAVYHATGKHSQIAGPKRNIARLITNTRKVMAYAPCLLSISAAKLQIRFMVS
jgi:hypothetical protein